MFVSQNHMLGKVDGSKVMLQECLYLVSPFRVFKSFFFFFSFSFSYIYSILF